MMVELIRSQYGNAVAVFFSVALAMSAAFVSLVCLYYREDIKARLSHNLNMWIYRMQTVWQDTEPECPEWADPVRWRQSNQF